MDNEKMPFGYNDDGTTNDHVAEVIRYVFAKDDQYFRKPPQELIDEAHEWAASEGMTLNEEEAKDMARARIDSYIALEVKEKFLDVKYRVRVTKKSNYPVGEKYPSKAFRDKIKLTVQ